MRPDATDSAEWISPRPGRDNSLRELMRWMPPFDRHRMMLTGAAVAREGGADGRRTYVVDRPGEA